MWGRIGPAKPCGWQPKEEKGAYYEVLKTVVPGSKSESVPKIWNFTVEINIFAVWIQKVCW